MSLFSDVHALAMAAAQIVVELKTLNATASSMAADVKKIADAVTADTAETPAGIAVKPGKETTT